MARIGLIQTRGIGDVVIALPIAAAFSEQGHTVLWPVDERWLSFLEPAAPYVEFLGVPSKVALKDYYVTIPRERLRQASCDAVHMLYSKLALEGESVQNEKLARFLKFDEYKYALTGVPFARKWVLELGRDLEREEKLFESLGLEGRPYICMHRHGSEMGYDVGLPQEWLAKYRLVEIDERTDSPFDWLTTLERADKIMCIDSCFSNLVEQLNFQNEKYLFLRNAGFSTPVLKNGWRFV